MFHEGQKCPSELCRLFQFFSGFNLWRLDKVRASYKAEKADQKNIVLFNFVVVVSDSGIGVVVV